MHTYNSKIISRLVTVGISTLAGLSLASTAFGAPPVKQDFGPFQILGFVIGDCGDFEIWNDVTEQGFFIEHYDKDGNIKHVNVHFTYSDSLYYNSENPEIFIEGGPVERLNQRLDFINGTDAVVGLGFKVTLPGGGVIFHSAGRLVFNLQTGELLIQAGPKDFAEGNIEALCSALST